MRKLDDINLDRIPARTIQLTCLVLLGLIECFTMIFGVLVDGPMKNFVVFYTSVAAALFVGVSIREPMNRTAKILLLTGAGFSIWMLVLQMSDFRHFSPTAYYGARFVYSAFLCEYLMMLPCAGILKDGEKSTGLKIVGGFYVAAGAALCLLTVMVYLQIIPTIFSRFMGWFDSRLGINWHPNVLARIFLLSMSLTVAFVCSARKLWAKILLGILGTAEFVGLVLTNSRIAVALGCCLLGGTVFFLIYRAEKEKGGWKRFLLGALAALVTIAGSFGISQRITQENYWYLMNSDLDTVNKTAVEIDGEVVEMDGAPREFSYGMLTFNGRTYVWAAALEAIADHPQVLLTGVKDTGKFITPYYESGYFQKSIAHSHNSWMEVLLRTGVVGFAVILWITWLALSSSIRLMFFRKSSLFQKVISMAVICIMGSEFFEPNLFYAETPASFINILFMLCVGYLFCWSRETEKLSLRTGKN